MVRSNLRVLSDESRLSSRTVFRDVAALAWRYFLRRQTKRPMRATKKTTTRMRTTTNAIAPDLPKAEDEEVVEDVEDGAGMFVWTEYGEDDSSGTGNFVCSCRREVSVDDEDIWRLRRACWRAATSESRKDSAVNKRWEVRMVC